MKNKQFLRLLLGIVVIGVGIYMIFFFNMSSKLTEHKEKIVLQHAELVKEKTPVFQSNMKESVIKVENPTVDKKVFFTKKNVRIKDAFTYVSVDTMRDILPPKKGIDPESAFQIKSGIIKSLKIGDTITITGINNIEYELKITKRIKNSDGSVTSKAQINGEDTRYFSILTEGKNTAFITLNSPEGSYQIEIFNGNGYVYSIGKINRGRIDYRKTDVLIPPTTNATKL